MTLQVSSAEPPSEVLQHRDASDRSGDLIITLRLRRDYFEFFSVLFAAYCQTAYGKGRERHQGEKPILWDAQPLMTELTSQRSPDFAIGQARKKLLESRRLEPAAAFAERLGAIVYATAAAVFARRQVPVTAEEPEQ